MDDKTQKAAAAIAASLGYIPIEQMDERARSRFMAAAEAALTHFATPRQRMMLDGMDVKNIADHLWNAKIPQGLTGIQCQKIAEEFYRLATTPAPEVDADAEAKRLAWEFHKAALVEIGAKNADDLWASFKDHQRLGWRAVAAMEKGNG